MTKRPLLVSKPAENIAGACSVSAAGLRRGPASCAHAAAAMKKETTIVVRMLPILRAPIGARTLPAFPRTSSPIAEACWRRYHGLGGRDAAQGGHDRRRIAWNNRRLAVGQQCRFAPVFVGVRQNDDVRRTGMKAWQRGNIGDEDLSDGPAFHLRQTADRDNWNPFAYELRRERF